MKKIILITGSEESKNFFVNQLREYIPDEIAIKGYALDIDDVNFIEGDFIVFSSQIVLKETIEKKLFNLEKCKNDSAQSYFVCERTLNIDHIDEVLKITEGSEVLFVNDSPETALTCISNLLELGITHLNYTPYFPGCEEKPNIKIALTAGESHRVPKYIQSIVDLGPRIIDIVSLYRIVEKVGVSHFDADRVMKKYMEKIINMSRKVADVNEQVEILKNSLRSSLKEKGYYARYTFDHIIGCSKNITEVKDRTKKLAETELTILIEGESGTGKELFASAIHNASKRKNGPFLAVNFSALPDELVESELFGYEEGAFTGAKKGGRIGLFELADGGTIFLDEIGDVSAKVQTRLLRVLQEKEIMPLGSNKIKKVDIRVIAATNKNLMEMVWNKQFRSDLYYRLKIGYVYLSPLRERQEDINALISHFVKEESDLQGIHIKISQFIFNQFAKYHWYGNARELQNIVKYMIAIRTGNTLDMKDLPDKNFFEKMEDKEMESLKLIHHKKETKYPDDELYRILKIIDELNQLKIPAGRERIAKELSKEGENWSDAQIRSRLKQLENENCIYINRGKTGVVLSPKGKILL